MELSRLTALNDTLHLYGDATYAQTALVDGEVAGVLWARIDGEKPYAAADMSAITNDYDATLRDLAASEVGQRIADYLLNDRADTERMSAAARQESQAELLLFILSPRARGHHLGSRLFEDFLTHLRARGVESYYLYTDSSCNFGFYDHRGLKRVSEHLQVLSVDGHPYDKFIYEGAVGDGKK